MKKKLLRLLALAGALTLILGLARTVNGLVGNPISGYLASKNIQGYLDERFPGTEFYIGDVEYNFKDGTYGAQVKIPGSIDGYFSIYASASGKVLWDTAEDMESGYNTALRLNQEYRELTDKVLESPSFPYHSNVMYGTLEIYPKEDILSDEENGVPGYALAQEDLVPDKLYDIQKLGKQAGNLVIYVESETVTAEKAAEAILDIRRAMDDAGIAFHAMEFHLEELLPEDGSPKRRSIDALEILRQDIYEEGMIGRMKRADEAAKAYYAKEDEELKGM